MHEQQKLDEAAFFLCEMRAKSGDPKPFIHCLSAFLSAARSAIQYTLREAATKPGGQAWFDGQVGVGTRPLISFFKDKRDINIHSAPVAPRNLFKVELRAAIGFSGEIDTEVNLVDGEGRAMLWPNRLRVRCCTFCRNTLRRVRSWFDVGRRFWKRKIAISVPEAHPPLPDVEVEVRYEFAERPGDDLLQLCDRYFAEVAQLVKEGQRDGWITS